MKGKNQSTSLNNFKENNALIPIGMKAHHARVYEAIPEAKNAP